MPDFVIALARQLQIYGLSVIPYGRKEPMLDPETVWRIPVDINAVPVPIPHRKIRPEDIRTLNGRRAGNRGRANARKTTPVLD
jgi:hypothetical protein